jgi:hypothetical protein
MRECFFHFPPCRPLSHSVLGSGVRKIASRIQENALWIVDVEGDCFAYGAASELPPRPSDSPDWSYAITLPFRVNDETGLAVLLGKYWCFWSTSTRSHSPWRLSEGISSPRMAMIAASTDISPFTRFCNELIHASKIHTGTALDMPKNNWPSRLHSQWFKVLVNTTCSPSPPCAPKNLPAFKISTPYESASKILTTLRVGTVVSSAWRASDELPEILGTLSHATGCKEEDIVWEELSRICAEI